MARDSGSRDVSRRAFLAGGAAAAPGVGVLGRRSGRAHALGGRHVPPGWDGGPPVPPPIVLTGGNVIDPLTGRVTEDAVVVLAGGKVQVVAAAAEFRAKRIG